MTRKQAIEYDNQLKLQLKKYLEEWEIDESVGEYIVDNFVEFTPQDSIKGIVFLNNKSASYKTGNARIDLKNAILAGLELCASLNKPESTFQYIQLLIVSAFFIRNATKQPLSKLEAYVVYQLHKKETYQFGIQEEQFIVDMQEWYQQKEEKTLEKKEIDDAIKHLYQLKVVDFDDGKIFLSEKVFGELG